jgi:branched-chain amino acid transport system substrate-binding protein
MLRGFVMAAALMLAAIAPARAQIHSIGLKLAQGLYLTEAFYWDLDDTTRAFAKRFAEKNKGKMPTSIQAGFYSATMRYLEAIKATGTDDADKVMANLKSGPWDDPVFGKSYVRPDGRNMHDMYLFQVKPPADSKAQWDYYKLIHKIPAEEAFRLMDQGECPMVKKG